MLSTDRHRTNVSGRRFGRVDGFTLIELLVVILVIGILAAIALPKFLGPKDSSMDAQAKSAVRNAATVALSYYTSNSQTFTGLDGATALRGVEPSLTTIADLRTATNPEEIRVRVENSGAETILCSRSRKQKTTNNVFCMRLRDATATQYLVAAATNSAEDAVSGTSAWQPSWTVGNASAGGGGGGTTTTTPTGGGGGGGGATTPPPPSGDDESIAMVARAISVAISYKNAGNGYFDGFPSAMNSRDPGLTLSNSLNSNTQANQIYIEFKGGSEMWMCSKSTSSGLGFCARLFNNGSATYGVGRTSGGSIDNWQSTWDAAKANPRPT